MKIIHYEILESINYGDLEAEVIQYIKAGFQPLGGVATTTDSDDDIYYTQAMATYDED